MNGAQAILLFAILAWCIYFGILGYAICALWRRRCRLRQRQCIGCAYDLEAQIDSPVLRCPECGAVQPGRMECVLLQRRMRILAVLTAASTIVAIALVARDWAYSGGPSLADLHSRSATGSGRRAAAMPRGASLAIDQIDTLWLSRWEWIHFDSQRRYPSDVAPTGQGNFDWDSIRTDIMAEEQDVRVRFQSDRTYAMEFLREYLLPCIQVGEALRLKDGGIAINLFIIPPATINAGFEVHLVKVSHLAHTVFVSDDSTPTCAVTGVADAERTTTGAYVDRPAELTVVLDSLSWGSDSQYEVKCEWEAWIVLEGARLGPLHCETLRVISLSK